MCVPFVLVFGISYFFTEFGPNTTTFIYPAEIFPTEVRTTAHGISAGMGKMGAFVGVYLLRRTSTPGAYARSRASAPPSRWPVCC